MRELIIYLFLSLDAETGNYYYGARYYDPKFSIWLSVDPLAIVYNQHSPYNYTLNNPVYFKDPDGKRVIANDEKTQNTILGYITDQLGENHGFSFNKTGELSYKNKALKKANKTFSDEQRSIASGLKEVIDGEKIGNSLTTHSFVSDNGKAVEGAIIDLNDQSGQEFFNSQLFRGEMDLWDYMPNATGGKDYDFKRNGTSKGDANYDNPRYHYRGMKFEGKIASARDVGNYSAGAVAGFNGKAWKGQARLAFDLLEKLQKLNPFSVEGKPTQMAQKAGHNLTYPTHLLNEKRENGPAVQKYKTIRNDLFYGNKQKW